MESCNTHNIVFCACVYVTHLFRLHPKAFLSTIILKIVHFDSRFGFELKLIIVQLFHYCTDLFIMIQATANRRWEYWEAEGNWVSCLSLVNREIKRPCISWRNTIIDWPVVCNTLLHPVQSNHSEFLKNMFKVFSWLVSKFCLFTFPNSSKCGSCFIGMTNTCKRLASVTSCNNLVINVRRVPTSLWDLQFLHH